MISKKTKKESKPLAMCTPSAVSLAENIANKQKVARPHFESSPPSTKTTITVKCNCGFPNNLYIRGEGIPGLNWNKGVLLKNVQTDEWKWETEATFSNGQIKILFNDKMYEQGNNHLIECGKTITFVPKF